LAPVPQEVQVTGVPLEKYPALHPEIAVADVQLVAPAAQAVQVLEDDKK